MRVLGIDYGQARIGLALSDPGGRLATPLQLWQRRRKRKSDIRGLVALAREREVGAFVVGVPLEMTGQRGKMANEVLQFCDALRLEAALPVHEWDERLTTVQAEAALRATRTRRDRQRALVDQVAAAIILQSWLDAHPRAEGDEESPSEGSSPAPDSDEADSRRTRRW